MKRTNKISLAVAALLLVSLVFGTVALAEGGHGSEEPAATSEGHGGSHEQSVNWWSANPHAPPVGWLIVDFVLLFGALYFILRKPVSAFLSLRRRTLSNQVDEVKKLKAEIDARSKEVNEKLEKIDQFRKEIMDSFTNRGQAEKQKLLENAEAMKTSIETSTKELIEREVNNAREKIRAEVTASAAVLAEEILKKNINKEDNDRLIKEFIKRLSEIKSEELR